MLNESLCSNAKLLNLFFLVEEAMRINKKLTSINEKQESTIKALKEVK